MFGRMLKTRLDLIHPNDSSRVVDHQFKQKWYHDRTSVPRAINVFDPVFVLNPGRGYKWITGHVINRIGNHIDQLRLRHCDPNPLNYIQPFEGDSLVSVPIVSQVPEPTESEPDSGVVEPAPPPSCPSPLEAAAVCVPQEQSPILRRSARTCKAPERLNL